MTLPANIRINVMVLFPARVQGSGFLTVTKANGIFTLGIDYSLLGTPIPINDPVNTVVAVFNLITKTYNLTTLATLIAAATMADTTITAAGDVTVTTQTYLRLKKTVPATTNIILPKSATRTGLELTVKDVAGNASSFNFALKGDGTEDVDGVTAAVGGYKGIMNFQVIRIHARLDGTGWDVVHSG